MCQASPEPSGNLWCALVVGNSRLHWAVFREDKLQQTWDVSYAKNDWERPQHWSEWMRLSPAFQQVSEAWPSLWMISMVPSQTQVWQTYPRVNLLQLADIPLQGVYASLGCDRALALWAAGEIYGWPVLVIDGGTALTLTGADASGHFIGGAILPGVRLQLQSLSEATALPTLESSGQPPRWGKNTTDAILSGVLYTLWSGLSDFIQSWNQDFDHSTIVLTGGDHPQLFRGLQTTLSHRAPATAGTVTDAPNHDLQNRLMCDEMLIFRGIQRLRTNRLESQ